MGWNHEKTSVKNLSVQIMHIQNNSTSCSVSASRLFHEVWHSVQVNFAILWQILTDCPIKAVLVTKVSVNPHCPPIARVTPGRIGRSF